MAVASAVRRYGALSNLRNPALIVGDELQRRSDSPEMEGELKRCNMRGEQEDEREREKDGAGRYQVEAFRATRTIRDGAGERILIEGKSYLAPPGSQRLGGSPRGCRDYLAPIHLTFARAIFLRTSNENHTDSEDPLRCLVLMDRNRRPVKA